jgi:hypothetical protein
MVGLSHGFVVKSCSILGRHLRNHQNPIEIPLKSKKNLKSNYIIIKPLYHDILVVSKHHQRLQAISICQQRGAHRVLAEVDVMASGNDSIIDDDPIFMDGTVTILFLDKPR